MCNARTAPARPPRNVSTHRACLPGHGSQRRAFRYRQQGPRTLIYRSLPAARTFFSAIYDYTMLDRCCFSAEWVSVTRWKLRAANSGPGRNDPCAWGSTKKFKRCCLDQQSSPHKPSHTDATKTTKTLQIEFRQIAVPKESLHFACDLFECGRVGNVRVAYAVNRRRLLRNSDLWIHSLGISALAAVRQDFQDSDFHDPVDFDEGARGFKIEDRDGAMQLQAIRPQEARCGSCSHESGKQF